MTALSASGQDYLKAIWSLGEWSADPVTPSALANRVGVRLSTASDAIRKLAGRGLVEHARYGTVTLTAAGRAQALTMVRRHRLIETFLVETLGYRWDQVHAEAENLEHAVSEFLIDRIDEFLRFPEFDPHGDPIPRADGLIHRLEAIQLSLLKPDQPAVVRRIRDDDAQLLRFLASRGIGVGTELTAGAAAPYSDAMSIMVADTPEPLMLGRSATDAIWVSPLPDTTG